MRKEGVKEMLKIINQTLLLIGLIGLIILVAGIYLQDGGWMGPGNAAFLLGILSASGVYLIRRKLQLGR